MPSLARAVDATLEATIVPSFTRIGYTVRRQVDGWRPLETFDLTGKVVLVTGATSGLGRHAAERLAGLGASVLLLARDAEKAERVRDEIAAQTGRDDVEVVLADLTDLDAVRRTGQRLRQERDRLDVLVHNAGAMFDERAETSDGVERTVALHVVGPHVLTTELLPLLRAAGGRVVTVSSGGMYSVPLDVDTIESPHDYAPSRAYARAKRAQVALTREWAARVPAVGFHAMHPGWVDTPGVATSLPRFRRIMGPLLRDVEQGADTIVWLAAREDLPEPSGTFWHDRRPRSAHKVPWTEDEPAERRRLWEWVSAYAGGHASTDPADDVTPATPAHRERTAAGDR